MQIYRPDSNTLEDFAEEKITLIFRGSPSAELIIFRKRDGGKGRAGARRAILRYLGVFINATMQA